MESPPVVQHCTTLMNLLFVATIMAMGFLWHCLSLSLMTYVLGTSLGAPWATCDAITSISHCRAFPTTVGTTHQAGKARRQAGHRAAAATVGESPGLGAC